MTITAIQPRRRGMSALYIDNEYAVDIDTETLLTNAIKVGMSIDDDFLKDLICKSNDKKAKEKALNLISYRDHSKKELIDKMSRTVGADAAKNAADKMEQLGLINDYNFAKNYAKELIERKKFSISRVSYELSKKGIDRDTISEILEQFSIDPIEQAISLIEKRYGRCIKTENGRRKAVAFLQRCGYSFSVIKSALGAFECNGEDDCFFE